MPSDRAGLPPPGHCQAIITTHIGHTVGSGLRLDAQPNGEFLQFTDADTEARTSAQLELLWAEWCASADLTRQWHFDDIQQIALGGMLILGDMLVLAVEDDLNEEQATFTTRLQLIEAQRISNPNRAADTPTIAGGVERDEQGRVIAYHVCSGYPHGFGRTQLKQLEWQRIPLVSPNGKRHAYHVMDPLMTRPGQSRGIPLLVPVIAQLKQLSDMTHAELTASVLAACLAVFQETEDGGASLPTAGGSDDRQGGKFALTDMEFQPGMVFENMMPGEKVGSIASNRPNTAFAAFESAIIAQIAAGTDLSKEVLTRHFQSSYSASRGALGEVWRLFSRRRQIFSRFCQWSYELMLDEVHDRNIMPLPNYATSRLHRRAWCQAQWVGPPMPQMDEQKAVTAATKRVEAGFSSRKEETNKLTGGDFNRNHRQLEREQRLRDDAGLVGSPAIDRQAVQDDTILPNQVDAE